MICEYATLKREPFSGRCDDVWKACDTVCRQLATLVAAVAGFPLALADAYLRFHRDVVVHNSFALGLGRPRSRALSGPQGCP